MASVLMLRLSGVFPVAVSERMLPSSKCGEEAIRAAEYRLILTNYPERQEIVLSS